MAEFSKEYCELKDWGDFYDFSIMEEFEDLNEGEGIAMICEGFGCTHIINEDEVCYLLIDNKMVKLTELLNKMDVSEKYQQLKNFLSSPENKLIFKDGKPFSAGTFFSIEVDSTHKEYEFSTSVKVVGLNEAVEILSQLDMNKNSQEIEKDVLKKLNFAKINPDNEFYLIIKGNIDKSLK